MKNSKITLQLLQPLGQIHCADGGENATNNGARSRCCNSPKLTSCFVVHTCGTVGRLETIQGDVFQHHAEVAKGQTDLRQKT